MKASPRQQMSSAGTEAEPFGDIAVVLSVLIEPLEQPLQEDPRPCRGQPCQ